MNIKGVRSEYGSQPTRPPTHPLSHPPLETELLLSQRFLRSWKEY